MRSFSQVRDADSYARAANVGTRLARMHVFGEEVKAGARGRRYTATSVALFAERMALMAPEERRAHEYYRRDERVRLFFDLERWIIAPPPKPKKQGAPPPPPIVLEPYSRDEFDADVQLIIIGARELVAETRAVAADDAERAIADKRLRVVWLDACRAEKVSCHVVFPDVVFENGLALRAFVEAVCARPAVSDRARKLVDLNVYGATRRSLRTAYSCATTGGGCLVPLREGARVDAFDREIFVDTLVTGAPAATTFAFPYDASRVGPKDRVRAQRDDDSDDDGDDEHAGVGGTVADADASFVARVENALAEEFLAARFPTAIVERENPREPFDVVLACKCCCGLDDGSADECLCAPCARRGEPHRKNRLYFRVQLPLLPNALDVAKRAKTISSSSTSTLVARSVTVAWRCMDEADCGKACVWVTPDQRDAVDAIVQREMDAALNRALRERASEEQEHVNAEKAPRSRP